MNKQTVPIAGTAPKTDTITYDVLVFDFFICQKISSSSHTLNIWGLKGPRTCRSTFRTSCRRSLLTCYTVAYFCGSTTYSYMPSLPVDVLDSLIEFGQWITAEHYQSSHFKKEACGVAKCIPQDLACLHALEKLPLPMTGVDLQQFLCAAGWLHDALIGYARG